MSTAATWYQDSEDTRQDISSHQAPIAKGIKNSSPNEPSRPNSAWPTPSEASTSPSNRTNGIANHLNDREQNDPSNRSETSSTTSLDEERSTGSINTFIDPRLSREQH